MWSFVALARSAAEHRPLSSAFLGRLIATSFEGLGLSYEMHVRLLKMDCSPVRPIIFFLSLRKTIFSCKRESFYEGKKPPSVEFFEYN